MVSFVSFLQPRILKGFYHSVFLKFSMRWFKPSLFKFHRPCGQSSLPDLSQQSIVLISLITNSLIKSYPPLKQIGFSPLVSDISFNHFFFCSWVSFQGLRRKRSYILTERIMFDLVEVFSFPNATFTRFALIRLL